MIGLLALLACADPPRPPEPGVLTVLQEQQSAWVRNFNPLLSTGGARWPAAAGIYEPLAIYNRMRGEWVPWLATQWSWEVPAQVLRLELRSGVEWSDGAAFTAEDVVYTFELLAAQPALDAAGLWAFIEVVEQVGPREVRVRFQRPYSPGFALVAGQPIVPRHVWSKVADPVAFANPDPVGTGPFTEVRRFDPQVWELGRNERWWGGAPAVEVLRFPAVGSNDQALLALVQGEVDWAGSFVPAVERTYASHDPEHRRWWFPAVSDTVFLYPQTTRKGLDDPRVRRALSLAVDRERLVKVALHDYATPAGPTALSDGYASWRRADLGGVGEGWVRHDPAAAAALLDEAGYSLGEDGRRRGPDGTPLELPLIGPAGWSDWVRAAQVIGRDLDALGVRAPVQGLDFPTWFDRVSRGDFALTLGWSVSGPTPYPFYRALMGTGTVRPVGEPAPVNWHRYGDARADALLAEWEATDDPQEQRRLSDALQGLFVEEAPAIPLFPTPSWGEADTSRFTGFPDPADPYAVLSPNAVPDALLVLTRLRPRDGAAAARR